MTKQERIVKAVVEMFGTFGGGKTSAFNPLSHILKDAPPQFALGVDVSDVVAFVLKEAKRIER